jgi:hypothetical protein
MKILEVEIDSEMHEQAMQRAALMGALPNSITRGEGNIAGMIGELIVLKAYPLIYAPTFDFDLKTRGGATIDVKTTPTAVTPKPYHAGNVATVTRMQDVSFYLFVRVLEDYSRGWVLGSCTPEQLKMRGTHFRKDQRDPSRPSFTYSADCWSIKIEKLNPLKPGNGKFIFI